MEWRYGLDVLGMFPCFWWMVLTSRSGLTEWARAGNVFF